MVMKKQASKLKKGVDTLYGGPSLFLGINNNDLTKDFNKCAKSSTASHWDSLEGHHHSKKKPKDAMWSTNRPLCF